MTSYFEGKDKFGCAFANSDESVFFPHIRKSCEGFPFFAEVEKKSYCVLHCPVEDKGEDFNKALKQKIDNKDFNFCGFWFPDEIDFHGFTFDASVDCYKAYFNKAASFNYTTFSESADFRAVVFKKYCGFIGVKFKERVIFKDTSFFQDAYFTSSQYDKEAIFITTYFQKSSFFNDTHFAEKADFYNSQFLKRADFSRAVFVDSASFDRTHFFDECDFRYSVFGSYAYLRDSTFDLKVDFKFIEIHKDFELNFSTFKDSIVFSGIEFSMIRLSSIFSENARIIFESANIKFPKKAMFHSVTLCPSWFVNIDPREFIFTNVIWEKADGNNKNVLSEIEDLKDRRVSNPYRLLIIACNQLSVNAEENNRYEEASGFRRMVLETQRLERKEKQKIWLANFGHTFKREINLSNFFSYSGTAIKNSWSLIKTFPSDVLHFLYRIFSGYGERWFRAFCWLIAIWLIWAILYATPICDFIEKEKYSFSYWIGYSLNVITLQRPEPKPANAFTMIILGLEVLFAPLQAALLILAVRRKFMR